MCVCAGGCAENGVTLAGGLLWLPNAASVAAAVALLCTSLTADSQRTRVIVCLVKNPARTRLLAHLGCVLLQKKSYNSPLGPTCPMLYVGVWIGNAELHRALYASCRCVRARGWGCQATAGVLWRGQPPPPFRQHLSPKGLKQRGGGTRFVGLLLFLRRAEELKLFVF